MAQYDVFLNPEGSGYLLDVQSDLLDGLSTRLVIPLLPSSQAPKPAARLNPVMNIKDEAHVMATQFMGSRASKTSDGSCNNLGPDARQHHCSHRYAYAWILAANPRFLSHHISESVHLGALGVLKHHP